MQPERNERESASLSDLDIATAVVLHLALRRELVKQFDDPLVADAQVTSEFRDRHRGRSRRQQVESATSERTAVVVSGDSTRMRRSVVRYHLEVRARSVLIYELERDGAEGGSRAVFSG